MNSKAEDFPALAPAVCRRMREIGERFRNEECRTERHIIDVGQPIPTEEKYEELQIHPAIKKHSAPASTAIIDWLQKHYAITITIEEFDK